jgi:hypothetical protein
MKIFICNALSLSMLDSKAQRRRPGDAVFGSPRTPVPCGDGSSAAARAWLAACKGAEIVSAVGHEDTAGLFSALLGFPVSVNRISVKLTDDSIALIGQLQGSRLPAGATELPEGASIEWWLV